jgi:hypothetical protein
MGIALAGIGAVFPGSVLSMGTRSSMNIEVNI